MSEIINNANPDLPDLTIVVPSDPTIDVSAWCANIRRALGKQYNIIFIFPDDNKEE